MLYFVLRGGSWFVYGRHAASGYRISYWSDLLEGDFGFRIVKRKHE